MNRHTAQSIFEQLIALPPGERLAALERFEIELAMRAEVEALLKSHDEAQSFLANPTASTRATAGPITESPGQRIGPYKLLQLIGEGGFGTVFLAEQTEPVRRRVALKIIKLGMDTKQVVARFEAERQALAIMDHPHIARVLDGGATASGRPYFVMEYVVGDTITAFADAHRLPLKARLELFSQVCAAVQHAHIKGVIHRDIKPANVLVSMVDGKPYAKVIDFGIAKAMSQPLTEKTLFTEHRQLIGTPEYMSPEQAEGSLDVDTRADVYALGVLLYELLTGTTPFDAKRLRSAAWGEMQRIIKEEDPPRPSARMTQRLVKARSAQEGLQSITSPFAFATKPEDIRGELDWIVMKCLDKARARRYDNSGLIASDIRNYLEGRAVRAAPPSRLYTVGKAIRRHRAAVIMIAMISGSLLIGLATTTWQWVRANNATHQWMALLRTVELSDADRTCKAARDHFYADDFEKYPSVSDLERAVALREKYLGQSNAISSEARMYLLSGLPFRDSRTLPNVEKLLNACQQPEDLPIPLQIEIRLEAARCLMELNELQKSRAQYQEAASLILRSSIQDLPSMLLTDSGYLATDPDVVSQCVQHLNKKTIQNLRQELRQLVMFVAYDESKRFSAGIIDEKTVAQGVIREAIRDAEALGEPSDSPEHLLAIGFGALASGNNTDAMAAFTTLHGRSREISSVYIKADALVGLITVNLRMGQLDIAKNLLDELKEISQNYRWAKSDPALVLLKQARALIRIDWDPETYPSRTSQE